MVHFLPECVPLYQIYFSIDTEVEILLLLVLSGAYFQVSTDMDSCCPWKKFKSKCKSSTFSTVDICLISAYCHLICSCLTPTTY